MKFWKQLFLPVMLLMGIITTLVYTSCIRNVCDNVHCFNGGSCNAGICRCPTGFENAQCQDSSIHRFEGGYAGLTTCNNLAQTIDTAWVTPGYAGILSVNVKLKSIYGSKGLLKGTVSSNESTYAIIVNNNDSLPNYQRKYSITLQSDKTLTIHEYNLDNGYTRSGDSSVSQCTFLGTKYTK